MATETPETFDYANLLIAELEQGQARNYSGRSNYGSDCLGFTYEDLQDYLKDALKLVAQVQRQVCNQETNELLDEEDLNTELLPDPNYLIDLLGGFIYDAMGRSSVVVYFPYKLSYPTSLVEVEADADEDN
jgi:hypothetical protein